MICSVILRLQGRLSSGEEGKGTEICGKKIKYFKNEDGEEYQIAGKKKKRKKTPDKSEVKSRESIM